MDVAAFVEKWSASGASERANKDLFLAELCDVLGVPRPEPATGDPARDRYVFEKPIPMTQEGGKVTTKRADLSKHGCFLLEAKQAAAVGTKKSGKTQRGTDSWDLAMVDARGQALGYASALDEPPPFLIVCDIGYVFELYADFDGTRRWPAFPNAQNRRIYLRDLAKHVDTLRAVFTDPLSLDPSRRAERVTREVAAQLAELAKKLEVEKNPPEAVAKFLMRCIFTMFAEDVALLPSRLFTEGLEHHWITNPRAFPAAIEGLWTAMNEGTSFSYFGKLLRFNGGLFKQPTGLPLSKESLALLLEAARRDWSEVDPAIFGTLLERALNPKERHKLGAHYTPRAYVERLIRPTIEEPLREEWENVQTAARKLYQSGKEKDARAAIRAYHAKLTQTRVLDPACGSGNFLYVTLDLFKRLESEVLALLNDLGERQELLHAEGIRVSPGQFLGIEVKPWAKEIAELVLWIGYLQWHFRTYGKLTPPPEPVLQDFRNIECRDAVLAWEREELVRDEKGKPVTRWDGETMKKHPVTGEMVPDEKATVPEYRYVNPREAAWPQAGYIIGNPPFLGNWRMRTELGNGYTEALRASYPEVPDSADFVMYWWHHAAALVRRGAVSRAGLITTTSITQTRNRRIVQAHLEEENPASLVFAIADHPWTTAKYDQASGGAEVRTAMTVLAPGQQDGLRGRVVREFHAENGEVRVDLDWCSGRINTDLTIGANVAGVSALRSNLGLSSPGVKLHGAGFLVEPKDLQKLGMGSIRGIERHIRPYRNGNDLAAHSRGLYVLDLDGLTAEQVRAQFPAVYHRIVERVKPERDHNNERYRRENWWLFGRRNTELRAALRGLSRYIATPESARRRYFLFLDGEILPDNMVVAVAVDDAYFLGVLSSRVHVCWALAAGGRLGIRHDPRYNKTRCFDPFPFPEASPRIRKRIAHLAERLDSHRKQQQASHPSLTLTKLYKALDVVRAGGTLNESDKNVWEAGLGATLLSLHEDLDAAVFEAYGWPADLPDEQILEKLVALNAERAAEEARGIIRWLRPEFQNPSGAQAATQTTIATAEETPDDEEAPAVEAQKAKAWPKKLPEQIAAVRDRLGTFRGAFSADDIAASFKGAKKADVADLLDGLAAVGVVVSVERGKRWKVARRRAVS
ncbi:class I SAM-dependent DNA methyltransferase [Polyangium fumosum]|uniref:site-specific DNA-methyltransferase (adenine-specific) n=1 Tax=Polyangium fumosum TaxID=889272 RepID=A0A4U1JEB0_9BACT|nr:DNA methyltransferase [Polyangium fumosum]TKD08448.1 class I SAM-dependent DNA methyltransferase [Polyangium fumosum]